MEIELEELEWARVRYETQQGKTKVTNAANHSKKKKKTEGRTIARKEK